MNRLRYETSPYLLQHARNPVDWYAWKAEAFERAQTEDKPMLVSIGYSTCHWCHVMERESFEDEETAAYMNENFINIKVDREERPDIDHIYMEACQAFSGQGGWPLNCFLMPDGRPFYAGTYYPPGPAYNRPSWRQLLENIVHAFRNKRDLVEKQADQLTSIIERSDQVFFRENVAWSEAGMAAFTREGQDRIYRHLQEQFDQVHGGFGGAPKFPGAMSLEYLLAYDHFFGEPAARRHVGLSLDRMVRGGIFDQLGGGFARYATDRAWLVPHFEKMLYDNALLVRLLAAAWQATGSSLYRDAIEATLSFTDREMTSPEGGFYSALDADSEGEEGKFYVWQKKEIEEVLGDEAEWVCAYFGVSEEGNWEGKNILWCPEPAEPFAASRGMQSDVFRSRLDKARALLLDRRAQRVRPGLDDKILLGWNALQASAYAKAYEALGHESYRQAAVRNLDFLLTHLRQPGGPAFYHTYKEGAVQYDAFLDDYAFLIDALLDVYSITFEDRFLDQAGEITEWVRASFFDPGTGLFFYTSADQWDVILRKRELYDSATPSGNSTMAHNLIRLGILLGRPDYREQAAAMVSAMRESIEKYSSSFSRWALAMLRLTAPDYEIAVVGHGAGAVARALYSYYLPYKAIMASEQTDERYPLLAGKAGDGPALIYICRQYSCLRPVADPGEAIRMLMPEKW